MKWITREKVKVDRVACPWLIRKFIDPQAQFLFVPADQVMDVAKREGATPYDVKGVEFGHHGKERSFDALVKKHGLTPPPGKPNSPPVSMTIGRASNFIVASTNRNTTARLLIAHPIPDLIAEA